MHPTLVRAATPIGPVVRALRADPPGTGRRLRTAAHNARPRRQRRVRRRAWVLVVVSLSVLLGGALAVSATAAPAGPAAAQPAPPSPAPSPPLPLPLPTIDQCPPDSPPVLPGCLQQPVTPPPPPCTGEGCIPQPPTTAPPSTGPNPGPTGGEDGEADCGITDIGGCITNAINAFFRGIVTAALNPLLDLLSNTLLTTPSPQSLPRVGELWTNSWQILLACYGLVVLIAGIVLMAYETLQTRHSVKEIAPRLVIGFLAGALSLWVCTKAIAIANGMAEAVMGGGLDANTAGTALREMVLSSLTGGIWIIFLGLFLAGMLVVLLVTYIVRVALTILLVAGAPLALMCHGLPQTEGIAQWWWKAFGGCLAIQVLQSLALITGLKVLLAPGGFTLFGPTGSGLINLLVVLALLYILFKIPFWVLGSVRGGGRSLLTSVVRGLIMLKIFSLFRGRGGAHTPPPSGGRGSGPGPGGRGSGGGGSPDPYRHTRATADGQYLLPLPGLRRTRPTAPPRPAPTPPGSGAARGRQLGLPLGEDWPENRPVLGRDGQYRLPLDVTRTRPPRPAPNPTPPPITPRGGRRTGRQLELPFDPYQGIRPTRTGQYPLPLDGLRRRATPTPPQPPAATTPASPVRRAAPQLRLPLDLPKPARRAPQPTDPDKENS